MAEEKQRYTTRGAQVVLTGDAAEAARGGLADDYTGNAVAKRAMEASGEVPDGYGPHGNTAGAAPAGAPKQEEGPAPPAKPAPPATAPAAAPAEKK